jgi:hypothetical protein
MRDKTFRDGWWTFQVFLIPLRKFTNVSWKKNLVITLVKEGLTSLKSPDILHRNKRTVKGDPKSEKYCVYAVNPLGRFLNLS